MTTYRCLLVYVPSEEGTIRKVKDFLWHEVDGDGALVKDLGDCEKISGKTPSEAAQEEAQKKAESFIPISGQFLAPECPIHKMPINLISVNFGQGCIYLTVECRLGRHFFNLNYDLESIDGLIKK